ncbi:hypothetical protein [Microbacterium sp. A93]|uniref:hypothetical protein n=1 Tax=Microbacterium sp. A93 TaxID=3450716 RepID=UPI003F422C7D
MSSRTTTNKTPKAPTRKSTIKNSSTKTKSTQKSTKKTRRSARPVILTLGTLTLAALLIVLIPVATSKDPLRVCVDDTAAFPAEGVAGWQGGQLENAAIIVRTAKAQQLERDGQILGVMAAMGESSLHNIDYGDWETSGITNPDGTRTSSIGLFQQQEWWGSPQERMDPASAAALFFGRLAGLAGWQQMEPTQAIHRVQINTDPNHYAQFEDDATLVVDALSGACPA